MGLVPELWSRISLPSFQALVMLHCYPGGKPLLFLTSLETHHIEETWFKSKTSLFSLHTFFLKREQIIFLLFHGMLGNGLWGNCSSHLLLTPRAEWRQCKLPLPQVFQLKRKKCHLGSLKSRGNILQEIL